MQNKMSQRLCHFLVLLTLLLCLSTSLSAAVIYVNNRIGADAFDGASKKPIGQETGPVKTIRRALQLAESADTIVVENTGTVYYESIQLVGSRHSGLPQGPFTLVGNGAVVSGAKRVPPSAWRQVGADLWQLKPWRKGHYQLVLIDKRVAEHLCDVRAVRLPEIPKNHWCAWRGSIYLRTEEFEDPRERAYSIAGLEVGLTLYRVHDVRILDVTFRHFRLDGINAHDQCRDVVLENVTASENGRAGLAVGGTSTLAVLKTALDDNRKHSVLITELGAAQGVETELSQPPTVDDQPAVSSTDGK